MERKKRRKKEKIPQPSEEEISYGDLYFNIPFELSVAL
jgi:hypothetical protein